MMVRAAAIVVCLVTQSCSAGDDGQQPSEPFVVAGYLPSYRLAAWSNDRMGPLNHLIYFHTLPTTDGPIPTDAVPVDVRRSLAAIKQATGVRLSLTVGGWGYSEEFAAVCADDDKRAALIASLVALCRKTAIDSIDYDWEHPENEQQWADYVTLLKETRSALSDSNGLCTVALAPWNEPPKALFAAVDRVHLMSYDHDYPHATLAKTTADIERMIGWGCPPRKLIVGIPFYGRGKEWTATTYATLVESGEVGDDDLSIKGVAYNGPKTVAAKVRLARERGLGGVMIWEVGQDTAGPKTSLLHAIGRAVRTGG